MKRHETNGMLNGIDDKFLNESMHESVIKEKKGKSKKIGIIGTIAACFCFISGTVYLTGKPYSTATQLGVRLSNDGVTMCYEQEDLIRFDSLMLGRKKGQKIDEFSDETVSWYKIEGSDNLKTIIRDDGNNLSKWKFIDYSFDEENIKNMKWIVENVFGVNSANDIKKLAVNDQERELDDSQKTKLYNYLLELKYPQNDDEFSLLEKVQRDNDAININIITDKDTLHFLIHPNDNVLQLNEDRVYSLFTIMQDEEFNN